MLMIADLISPRSWVRWLRNHFTFPVVIIFAFVLNSVVLPSSLSWLLASLSIDAEPHWRHTPEPPHVMPMKRRRGFMCQVLYSRRFNRVMNKKMVNGFTFTCAELWWLMLSSSLASDSRNTVSWPTTSKYPSTPHVHVVTDYTISQQRHGEREGKCKVLNSNYKIPKHTLYCLRPN